MKSVAPNRAFLLTPPGAGPIALIRVAGPSAVSVIRDRICGRGSAHAPPIPPHHVCVRPIEIAGERLDEAVVWLTECEAFPVVDLSIHGSVRIVERILSELEKAGVGLASKDECVENVWLPSNTFDREAMQAMLIARTARALRFAAWQRVHLPAHLRKVVHASADSRRQAADELRRLAERYPAARTLLGGATVLLVGPPNSGKSTLLNRLVGRHASVVAGRPGTTRDWVACELELEGIPTTLIDTAGCRETDDGLERKAIDQSSRILLDAKVGLIVLDATCSTRNDSSSFERLFLSGVPTICVQNKIDLLPETGPSPRRRHRSGSVVSISARSGEGLPTLISQVACVLDISESFERFPALFTERQIRVTERIVSDLESSDSPIGGDINDYFNLFVR